ncbi:DUF3019 domain-containing protein [Glaciecola sp. 1036]|uniref:DUF3019 domain-containing protein n=1 Tax=Alteromonadaceae TaxID=72275 RepID=UPI003D07ADAD
MKLFAYLTITLALLLFSNSLEAMEWEVIPEQCIVSQSNEVCDAKVRISVTQNKEVVCIRIIEKLNRCLPVNNTETLSINLKITGPVSIELLQQNGDIIDIKQIKYTLINAKPKRRRVKLPWSVF